MPRQKVREGATGKAQSSESRPVIEVIRVAEDAIRNRAQQIWQLRIAVGADGDQLPDWLQAERELQMGEERWAAYLRSEQAAFGASSRAARDEVLAPLRRAELPTTA